MCLRQQMCLCVLCGCLTPADAPPEQWANVLGVQLDSEAADTHFIVLADPEFSKLMELTAGLDFAFPAANKIGEEVALITR